MEKVIVTLTDAQKSIEVDVEVMLDLPVQRLYEQVQTFLRLPVPVRGLLLAGRPLRPGDTLAQAGVWDGSLLEVQHV